MDLKLARKNLLQQREDLYKQLKSCEKELNRIEKKISDPLIPKDILEPLQRQFKKLDKERVVRKDLPVKIVLSWDEGLRIDMWAELDLIKLPAKTKLSEYQEYMEEIKAFDAEVRKIAKELEVSASDLWDVIID